MCESCGCGRAPDGDKPALEGAHEHWHVHADGTAHSHPHDHAEGGAHRLHRHVHRAPPVPGAAEREADAAESSRPKDDDSADAGPPQD